MNKAHDYRALEREYIVSDISIRELCRRHGIRSHSVVVDQSQKHDWAAKREAYRAKADEAFIEKHAEHMAERQARIYDNILDTIDEAITKAREDMKATKLVRQPDGSMREEPAWLMKPRDVGLLISRFEVLIDRPSHISQHQGLTVTSAIPADALRQFIEMTRDVAGPPPQASPLPRSPRRLDG